MDYEELKQARFMDFRMVPISNSADALNNRLLKLITDAEQRQRRRRLRDAQAFKEATVMLNSDLMGHCISEHHRWLYLPMNSNQFIGGPIGYKTFAKIVGIMEKLQLIDVIKGSNIQNPFPNGNAYAPGLATRLKPSGKLIKLAGEFGIYGSNIASHFKKRPSLSEVRLKSSSQRFNQHRQSGRNMRFTPDDAVLAIIQRLHKINRFLVEQEYSGMRFYGLRRIFNEGDRADFKWNLGGRLYAVDSDGNYQMLKKTERAKITMNGEPTVELDVNASYLRILHGLRGIYLRPCDDIYDVKGLDRRVTKAWIASTLGHTGFHRRWPSRAISELDKQGVKLGPQSSYPRVQEIVLEHFSVLRDWPDGNIRWSRLMFEESEAMLEVMEQLQTEGIPSLPVHDSLIVPKSDGKRAHYEMMEVFERRFQVPFIINGL